MVNGLSSKAPLNVLIVVNVGGVIRVMKNFGLSDLRLVNPDEFDPYRLEGIAHRTRDLIEAGIVDPTLSTAAIVTLCQAISFGFVVMGAIDKPTAPADEWNTVIHRLITAALPASPPTSPSKT